MPSPWYPIWKQMQVLSVDAWATRRHQQRDSKRQRCILWHEPASWQSSNFVPMSFNLRNPKDDACFTFQIGNRPTLLFPAQSWSLVEKHRYFSSSLTDEFARAVYVATGLKLTRHLVNTIFKIFDVDHDDQLSYKEFIGIMKDRLHRGVRVSYCVCVWKGLWCRYNMKDCNSSLPQVPCIGRSKAIVTYRTPIQMAEIQTFPRGHWCRCFSPLTMPRVSRSLSRYSEYSDIIFVRNILNNNQYQAIQSWQRPLNQTRCNITFRYWVNKKRPNEQRYGVKYLFNIAICTILQYLEQTSWHFYVI